MRHMMPRRRFTLPLLLLLLLCVATSAIPLERPTHTTMSTVARNMVDKGLTRAQTVTGMSHGLIIVIAIIGVLAIALVSICICCCCCGCL